MIKKGGTHMNENEISKEELHEKIVKSLKHIENPYDLHFILALVEKLGKN